MNKTPISRRCSGVLSAVAPSARLLSAIAVFEAPVVAADDKLTVIPGRTVDAPITPPLAAITRQENASRVGRGYLTRLSRATVPLLLIMGFVAPSYALKKNTYDGRCTLSEPVLSDPDAVVLDTLENAVASRSSNCNDTPIVESNEKFLGSLPVKASKLKRSGWGLYRDFRINGVKPGDPVDGYETLIYDVELIYVAMVMDGPYRAICERARLPLRVVHTPWGWRPISQYGFGSNLKSHYKEIRRSYEPKKPHPPYVIESIAAERDAEIGKLQTYAARCALKFK